MEGQPPCAEEGVLLEPVAALSEQGPEPCRDLWYVLPDALTALGEDDIEALVTNQRISLGEKLLELGDYEGALHAFLAAVEMASRSSDQNFASASEDARSR